MSLFFLLLLTVVSLAAAKSSFHFPKIPDWLIYTTLIAIVYPFNLMGLRGHLFSLGKTSFRISNLILPFLLEGTEV